ncbi:FecCD family ABC transporter permease [Undibacterium oligocarboniphilum]|uniref:Iron ABC transporter permease n=1 Tax=Undibacterium oligocarboniphilum TaxID=666702 RepID=A0A850QNT2_9BURK|nr:iron ABC transporter permease [Undibacterium oligocarboniphilum]MBC3871813.1 iron ABC transporter permease [Undibacterium oligocarboniphilum]NVO79335.1 iron ABC transporter permease [Undibacterium oligocarboniphilum]
MAISSAERHWQAVRTPRWQALPVLLVAALASLVLACVTGSVPLSFSELLQAASELSKGAQPSLAASLLDLRLGRALTGFITGATLSLAGVLMQALLRNPLADPYVLGISGGAAVGALATILFYGAFWMVDLAAFGGAITVALLLFALAYRDLRGAGSSDGSAPLLLLTGVIVAAGCGALITLMLSVAPDSRLRGMVFWMIGDLSNTQSRYLPWLIGAAVLLFVMHRSRAINVAAMHADNASTLGVHIGRLRQSLFVCAALLTASAVSTAGSIGFVGLIMPHACRFALGPDHRLLIPAATLAGGSFLVLADTIARTAIAPQQLPVGVITAIIGVPVFLLQLHHLRRR